MQSEFFENLHYMIFIFLSFIFLSISLYIIRAKDLLSVIACLSILSLLMALYYLILDAPDVALTEAAVGACATTVILFFTAIKLRQNNILAFSFQWSNILIYIVLFGILVIIGFHIPDFGAVDTITNNHVASHYIRMSGKEIGINSVVASILASYRGLDTFCETLVIAIGGIAVSFILRSVNSK